jgi:hypothetical protein
MKRIMPFGKYVGQPIKTIPSDYLQWLLKNCNNLHSDLIEAAELEIHGRHLQYLYELRKRDKRMRRKAKSRNAILLEMNEQNRMAARIILGNPDRYQGLMAEWAAMIMANEMGQSSRRRDPHWEASRAVKLGVA